MKAYKSGNCFFLENDTNTLNFYANGIVGGSVKDGLISFVHLPTNSILESGITPAELEDESGTPIGNLAACIAYLKDVVNFFFDNGGGGLQPAISFTFTELQTAIGAGELLVGQSYLITDYETRHCIDGTDNLNDNNAPEPLLCVASATNNIFAQVYSPSNPSDFIIWDWTDDLCENVAQTPRTGKIIYRKDVVNNIETFWDFRRVQVIRDTVKYLSIPVGSKNVTIKKAVQVSGNYSYNDVYFANPPKNVILGSGTEFNIAAQTISFLDDTDGVVIDSYQNTEFQSRCRSVDIKSIVGTTFQAFCVLFRADRLSNFNFQADIICVEIGVYESGGLTVTNPYICLTFNMISPDNSLWANSIDNAGVVTTVKLT